MLSTKRPRPRATTTRSTSARLASSFRSLVRSSRSRFSVSWLCSTRARPTGRSWSSTSTTRWWFRIYKIPDGKPENQFAFSGECKNKKYAMEIVRECAEAWEKLATGKTPKEDLSLYVSMYLPL
jgi:hypothetical protein